MNFLKILPMEIIINGYFKQQSHKFSVFYLNYESKWIKSINMPIFYVCIFLHKVIKFIQNHVSFSGDM